MLLVIRLQCKLGSHWNLFGKEKRVKKTRPQGRARMQIPAQMGLGASTALECPGIVCLESSTYESVVGQSWPVSGSCLSMTIPKSTLHRWCTWGCEHWILSGNWSHCQHWSIQPSCTPPNINHLNWPYQKASFILPIYTPPSHVGLLSALKQAPGTVHP